MILVDTSVWIDHLRTGVAELADALDAGRALGHPWVIGEIALGNAGPREELITLLGALPAAKVATEREVATMVSRHALGGSGIGYVDAQLLAATVITGDALLWTRDKRLRRIAERLGVSHDGG